MGNKSKQRRDRKGLSIGIAYQNVGIQIRILPWTSKMGDPTFLKIFLNESDKLWIQAFKNHSFM